MSIYAGSKSLQELMVALAEKRPQIHQGVLSWGTASRLRYPWRQSGKAAYEVLVGELWLQKATCDSAVRVYDGLVQSFDSIQTLAEASEDRLTNFLSRFRLQQHTQHIRVLAERLLKEGKGEMPRDEASLVKASELKQHSIRAIMCFGYGLPVAIIDPHAERMLSRLFSYTLPLRPDQGLLHAMGETLLPGVNPQLYNRALLDLAESVCRYENPLCRQCPVEEVCDYASASLGLTGADSVECNRATFSLAKL